MNLKNLIAFLIIIICFLVAFISLEDDFFSPYVSVAEAKKRAGEYVQIIGFLNRNKPVKSEGDNLFFSLIDKNNLLIEVLYSGTKPYNFDQAKQVVVIGQYNLQEQKFKADKILTKCPSKYEQKKQ